VAKAPLDTRDDCHAEWQNKWVRKMQSHIEREQRRLEKRAARAEQRYGIKLAVPRYASPPPPPPRRRRSPATP